MIHIAEKSVAGRQVANQDASLISKLAEGFFFLGVADGMGSSVSGRIASSLTLESASKQLMQSISYSGNIEGFDSQAKTLIPKLFYRAHIALSDAIDKDPSLSGMASTLCAGIIFNNKLIVGNIGSSGCMILSGRSMKKITTDHTHLQELLNYKQLYPDSGSIKKFGYMVTRFINGSMFNPDVFPLDMPAIELIHNDVVLFYTDGLILDKTDETPQFIKRILLKHRNDLEGAAHKLIEYALKHGADDNISVALARYENQNRQKVLMYF
jgi:PPM family protein phosphatase